MSLKVTGDQIYELPVQRVPPLNPTRLKVAGLVVGLLLTSAAVASHFLHINTVAVYSTGIAGGGLITAMVIWSLINCAQKIKQNAENAELQKNQKI